jgi:hypothetical protein
MSEQKSGDSRETLIAGALALIADKHAELMARENYRQHVHKDKKWYK